MTLLEEVRLELGESSSLLGTYFWTTTEVCNAVNAALMAAYIDADNDTAIGTMTLTASATDVTIPFNNVMIPKRVVGPNGEVFPISKTDLENYRANYNIIDRTEVAAAPKWVIPFGYEEATVWPIPDQSYSYTVFGVGWPGEISESVDVTLDHELREAVVALAIAFLVDDYYPELCDIKYMEYTQFILAYKRTLRNRRGRTPVAIKPSGRFDRARSGSIPLGSWYR